MDDFVKIGDVVHFQRLEVGSAGFCRPAVVVRVWGGSAGCVQLQVLTDGSNDGAWGARGVVWETSVLHDAGGGQRTWHSRDECPFRALEAGL